MVQRDPIITNLDNAIIYLTVIRKLLAKAEKFQMKNYNEE